MATTDSSPYKLTIGCDNINALDDTQNYDLHPRITVDYANFDLIHSARAISPSNLHIKSVHIKGHMDDITTKLTPLEQLNVRMDTLAKKLRASLETQHASTTLCALLPAWKWIVKLNGTTIHNLFRKRILSFISSERTHAYLSRRNRIPPDTFHTIDWHSLHKAIKKQPLGMQRWVTKHGSGICGVNSCRCLWRDRDDDACPRCGAPETARHVFLCTDPNDASLWDKEITALEPWLDEINTDPDIIPDIISSLRKLRNGQHVVASAFAPIQQPLGWANFFEGIWNIQW